MQPYLLWNCLGGLIVQAGTGHQDSGATVDAERRDRLGSTSQPAKAALDRPHSLQCWGKGELFITQIDGNSTVQRVVHRSGPVRPGPKPRALMG
ncbi:hypothetical protein D3C76_1711300 [compost metagenome]